MGAAAVLKRLSYGALFVVGVPALLIAWAATTSTTVTLPALHSLPAGTAMTAAGMILIAAGGLALIRLGRGLPMNAFPPARLVRGGVYRYVSNPMYLGFGLCCFGVAVAAGSGSGLWLVSPVACLAAAALVFGYERHDLVRRFGDEALRLPLLSLPRGNGQRPTSWQRAAVYVWVMAPWLVAYYGVQFLGPPPDGFSMALPFERGLPVLEWTELIYASVYIFVPLTPLLILTRRDLRRFAVMGGIGTFAVTLLWLIVPVVLSPVAHDPLTLPGRLLEWERADTTGVAAFPAFHVVWALIAAEAWRANARASANRTWSVAGIAWAGLIAISCITTRMHVVLDIVAAIIVFVPLRRYEAVWAGVRAATERVANSWREWVIGPVRLISHGVWAAAAAGVGLVLAGILAGPDNLGAVVWIAVCALLGAGLWAQLIEGSAGLLRPFGWYGGLIGGAAGVFMAASRGAPLVLLLASFAVASPWIQILGRVRCLVQGCCHGGPAPDDVGIRYTHRRSRVTHLADLAGRPIHATPLYSIAGNVVIGLLLLRLWSLSAPPGLVLGGYLILSALARFVEESWRAEPQTPIVGGLHIYQWLALGSLLIGIACTTIVAPPPAVAFHALGPALLVAGLSMGLLAGFSMGIDFPRSNRRFSRLAPVD